MSSAVNPQKVELLQTYKAAVIISIWSTAVKSVQWEILVQFMGGISQSKCSAVCSVFYYLLFITVHSIDLSQSGFAACLISISKCGSSRGFLLKWTKMSLASFIPRYLHSRPGVVFVKGVKKILFPCRICPCSLKLSSIALSIFLTSPRLKYQSSPPPPIYV